MTTYKKLSSGDSTGVNSNDIQYNLRQFQSKIKEFQRAQPAEQRSIDKDIKSIRSQLKGQFSKPRITSEEKSRIDVLEKQYAELKNNYSKLKNQSNYHGKSEHSDEIFDNIQERDSLVVTSEEIKEQEFMVKRAEIEQLQKDMVIVNEMFKDTAMMVKEQGDMIQEADTHVTTAAGETGKAIGELHKADKYQQKAKRKMVCIFVIALVVVGVLLAIVLGVVVF